MKQVNIRIPQRILALMMGLFLSIGAYAQITVQGHVKDATGEPVIGATVTVVGTTNTVATDFDGNLHPRAPSSKFLLSVFSHRPLLPLPLSLLSSRRTRKCSRTWL